MPGYPGYKTDPTSQDKKVGVEIQRDKELLMGLNGLLSVSFRFIDLI